VVAQKTVAIVHKQQDTTSVEGNDLMTVSKLKHKLYGKIWGSSRVCGAAWRMCENLNLIKY
jgi:hypothetical protein